jgi:hypothetical protein
MDHLTGLPAPLQRRAAQDGLAELHALGRSTAGVGQVEGFKRITVHPIYLLTRPLPGSLTTVKAAP